jgi:dipeptidyl aminopeptidase/acylaminoacyl peptidase
LQAEIDALPFEFDPAQADPAAFLGELKTPLNIQHATGDPSVPFAWSEATYDKLQGLGRPVTLYVYPTADHLFAEPELRQAIERDSEFFLHQPN